MKGLLFLLLFLVSCGQRERLLQIKGSDTMVNLNQALAEAFKEESGISVAVTGGGSGTGIASLLNRTCDIAACSRKMKEKELELAKKKGIEVKEYVVARDGICVVVNPKNPVERLALSELKAIFSGSITSWKQVNGEDAPIVVLSRDVNSGTHIYFKEYVLEGAEYIESALLMPSSQAVADEVAQNENAIGYYGIGYLSPAQKAVAVAKDRGSLYVKPTIETVRSGRYCISRPLFFYTPGEPEGKTKKFLEFVLSEKGQRIVREQDFVPVR